MERYAPSGRFGPLALVGVVVAAVAAGALAWGYQFAVDWIPLVYLEFLATIGFGMALGYLVRETVVRGKLRNPAVAMATLGVVVLAGWGASFWWAYERAVTQAHDEMVKEAPADEPAPSREAMKAAVPFTTYLGLRAEEGWHIGRIATSASSRPTISGFLVYVVWLVELGILGFYAWKRAKGAAGVPFCEACGAWATPTEHPAAVGGHASDVADAADAGDLRRMLTPKTDPSAARALGYVVHACPSCDASAWLDVTSEEVRTKGNKQVLVSRPVVKGIALTRDQVASVAATRKAHAAAAAAEAKAAREAAREAAAAAKEARRSS